MHRLFPGFATAVVTSLTLTGCAVAPAGAEVTTGPSPTPPASASTPPVPTSPASPSTTDTTGQSDDVNDVAVDEPVTAPTPQEGATVAIVDVAVTNWGIEEGWLDASAVVSGVIAADGTCQLELTNGTQQVAATGPAARSASSSSCAEGLRVRTAGLPRGDWLLTIGYLAEGFQGYSDPMVVAIP